MITASEAQETNAFPHLLGDIEETIRKVSNLMCACDVYLEGVSRNDIRSIVDLLRTKGFDANIIGKPKKSTGPIPQTNADWIFGLRIKWS